jgi:hypothetical protein
MILQVVQQGGGVNIKKRCVKHFIVLRPGEMGLLTCSILNEVTLTKGITHCR